MSWKGVDKNKVLSEAKKDKQVRERLSGVLFGRNTPLDTKYVLFEKGLQRSPIPFSVWGVSDGDTYAVKPKGVSDTHMVEGIYLDKEKRQIWCLDTYPPFIKILPSNYNPDFAMGRTVKKTEQTKQKNWVQDLSTSLWEFIKDLFRIIR